RHALRGRHDFRRDRELDAAAQAPGAVAAALEKGTEMTDSRTKPAALNNPIVLAFSGGLDTSFCVPWLKETYGRDVVTATVNTGGLDAEAAAALERAPLARGAPRGARSAGRRGGLGGGVQGLGRWHRGPGVRARLRGGARRAADAREEFFDSVLKYLIMGNVRRGQMYPLCVGAERGVQARHLAEIAKELGASTVAHGCTAAGNDQVRFEIILKTLAPGLEVLAPV